MTLSGSVDSCCRTQSPALFPVVEQHDRSFVAQLAKRGEGAPHCVQQILRGRVRVAHRPARADAGADPAPLAEKGIDLHAISRASNRVGRTGVQAAGACDQPPGPVDADVGVVSEVARLLELPHEVGHRGKGALERDVLRGMVVAGRRHFARDERVLVQVEHQVEGPLVAQDGRRNQRLFRTQNPELAQMAVDRHHVGADDSRFRTGAGITGDRWRCR